QKNKEYRRKNCDIENKCKFWDCDEVPSDAICIKGQCQKVERTAVTATYKELIDKLKPECAADNDCVLVTKYDGCCPGCDQQAISRIAEIEQQVFLKKNCDEMVICPEYVCTQQPEYYAKCVDSKCKKVECSGEGDAIVLGTMACCNGLKAVGGWPGGYTGDCSLPSPPTGLSICTKCGDGVCNTKTGENKCNCSTDCK
ncbi:MAG: hypothetical protein NT094_00245, partial [Candidatus Staskawiczbacteria bacterium]|nr:hypothetical protein [Candidatus Staskawiczbacteria bacterium]